MNLKDRLIILLSSGTYNYEEIKQKFNSKEQWMIKAHLEDMLEKGVISMRKADQVFIVNPKRNFVSKQNNQNEITNFELVTTLPENISDKPSEFSTTREIFRKIFRASYKEMFVMQPFIDNTFIDIYEDEIRRLANNGTRFTLITRKIIHENINLKGLFKIFNMYSNSRINSKFQIYEHWIPLRNKPKYINQFVGMHAKVMYCDDMAYIGSANWTSYSLSNNLELGIIVREKELLKKIKNLFLLTLSYSTKIDIDKIYKNLTRRLD